MKLLRTAALTATLALVAAPLAAQTIKVTEPYGVGASSGVASHGVYVGPYTGVLSGAGGLDGTIDVFCDDYLDQINVGDSWGVNLTNLGADPLTNTRFGAVSNAGTRYLEAAWLASQFGSAPTTDWGAIHAAIWNIMTPGSPNTSAWSESAQVQFWLTAAANSYGTVNPFEWYVLTPSSDPVSGYGQEFLIRVNATPEPATLILLGTGLALTLAASVLTKRIA